MKRYELNLSEYEVEIQKVVSDAGGNPVIEDGTPKTEKMTEVYPLRKNINKWLRTMGVFKNASDIAEAVTLAKAISDCEEDVYVVDEREASILRKCIDRFIEWTAEGKWALGGPVHEEAILRVAGMKEVE